MPNFRSTAAEKGPASPYRKIPIETTLEIPPRLQPKSFSNGSIKRLGMDRIPAETSKVTKVTARTTHP